MEEEIPFVNPRVELDRGLFAVACSMMKLQTDSHINSQISLHRNGLEQALWLKLLRWLMRIRHRVSRW